MTLPCQARHNDSFTDISIKEGTTGALINGRQCHFRYQPLVISAVIWITVIRSRPSSLRACPSLDGQHKYRGRLYLIPFQATPETAKTYLWPYHWLPDDLMNIEHPLVISNGVSSPLSTQAPSQPCMMRRLYQLDLPRTLHSYSTHSSRGTQSLNLCISINIFITIISIIRYGFVASYLSYACDLVTLTAILMNMTWQVVRWYTSAVWSQKSRVTTSSDSGKRLKIS
jgi:hypothetical protein